MLYSLSQTGVLTKRRSTKRVVKEVTVLESGEMPGDEKCCASFRNAADSHSPQSDTMAAEKDTTLLKNISGSSSSETFNTALPSPDKGRATLPKNPQPLIPDDASPFIRSLVSMLVDNNEEAIEFSNNGRIEIKDNEKLAKILAKYKLGGKNARVGSFRRVRLTFGYMTLLYGTTM
jgi:hypothetical protein